MKKQPEVIAEEKQKLTMIFTALLRSDGLIDTVSALESLAKVSGYLLSGLPAKDRERVHEVYLQQLDYFIVEAVKHKVEVSKAFLLN